MRFIVIFFSFMLLGVCPLSAQDDEPPYDRWIQLLSTKNDLRGKNYKTVELELLASDSLKFCEIFSTLKSKFTSHDKRVEIRLMNLEARFKSYHTTPPNCPWGGLPPEELFLMALNKAYELEDDFIIFQLYVDLVSYYADKQICDKAILNAMLAKDLFDQKGKEHFFPMYYNLHNLTYCLYHSREYRSLIDIGLLFLLPESEYLAENDTAPLFNDMIAWNTVGLAYTKIGIYDSAFLAFDHSIQLAQVTDHPFWISLVNGNRGDAFFKMGQLDSAEALLTMDYQGSIAAKEYDNAANSLQWLARIDLMHKNPKEALRKAREAYRLLQLSSKPDYLANTLLTFTKVFVELGETDSVNLYMDLFLSLHDSIEHVISDSRTANVMMRLESQENIHTIRFLNKEKRRIELIRNFTILFIIMLSLMGLIILNRQKLKLKVRRQQALDEKRIAEQEARSANEQLILFTRSMIEKNALVETLQQQLLQREISEEQKNHIAALSGHVILTDEDWENFKKLFEKVYPAFFYKLRQKVSDLTLADMRIAAMSKLQLSNKEAATLLGIAPNSVLKGRQRLRHRLGLEPETDLEQHLAHSPDFN